MMTKKICLLIFLISCFANAQYVGGSDDGSDKSSLIGSRLNGGIASFSVLYQGSIGDGHDAKTNQLILSTTIFEIYKGSSGDGFSQNLATVTINGGNINNLYVGNLGDGYSQDAFQSTLNGEDLSILFKGDNGDGADFGFINSVFLEGLIVSIYNGGFGDGFSSLLKPNNYLSGLMLILYNGGSGDGFASNILTSALTLDLVEYLAKMEVLLYPNPANHLVTIKPSRGIIISSVELYDVSGKRIQISISNENKFNVSNLEDGIYLLNIYSEERGITKKLVVKK